MKYSTLPHIGTYVGLIHVSGVLITLWGPPISRSWGSRYMQVTYIKPN